jgi:hypothetical protein
MRLIEELIDELSLYSKAYNRNEIDKDTLNLKLQLLYKRVELIEINFSKQPLLTLPPSVQGVFRQLLFSAKYTSLSSIEDLIKANGKRDYNHKARLTIGNKLYFKSIGNTMKLNLKGYADRNQPKYVTEFDIFIIGRKEDDTNES